MDSQTFFYWALGGGFLLLVLFSCIAIFYVIRILRDVSDATSSVRETAEIVNENVVEMVDKVNDTADQLLNSVVKPFTMFHFIADKIKPFLDLLPRHHVDKEEEEEEEEEAVEENSKKKARRKRSKRASRTTRRKKRE